MLIVDEATSGLDQSTAEPFVQIIYQLRGKVTKLFIAHNLPRNVQVDDVFAPAPPPPVTSG